MLRGKTKVGLVLAVGALLCSGCIEFQSPPTASQNGTIGTVHVSVAVCSSFASSAPTGACATNHSNTNQSPGSTQTQVWLGFRVPAGTADPATFSSSSTGPSNTGPQLNFSQSTSYTSELQRLDPAPAGMQWVGYVSQYFAYNNASGEQNFTAGLDFGLPRAANGGPFAPPFSYQVVVGAREQGTGTPDPTQPVNCMNSLTVGWGTQTSGPPGENQNWVCVDDPAPGTAPGQLDANSSLPTRDAGVEPGPAVTAVAGTTASVPFTFAYAGASPAGTFTLTGGTTVAGAKATPSVGTVTPASTSSTPVKVSVPIPMNAKPGHYTVTLTARLPDGESRTASVMLNVQPPLCVAPNLKGKTLNSAKSALRANHCRLGKVSNRHSKTKKGRIVAQSPGPHRTLPNGAAVSVTVSSGPKRNHH